MTLIIDIGGAKFTVALFEGETMVRRQSYQTNREGGREWMLREIEAIAKEWRAEHPFDRCGVGFGGPVDFSRQRVALSTHVPGWADFPLAAYLEASLGVPVMIDNDANLGALGESRYGAGRGFLPLFYMTLSTGIGGGLILEDGRIYRGADSWAGEIGHITLHPDGPECLCGARGCFERMCSGLWKDPGFTASYVVDLAQGLKAAIMLLNPARIVIGGGIAKAGENLFGPLRAELRRHVTRWSGARLDVAQAELADDSVLWGALALIRGAGC